MNYFLSIDLKVNYGRHTVGYYEDNKLKNLEVYRFENKCLIWEGHLTWDLDYLFIEVIRGIRKAVLEFGKIDSLSITAWDNDYVLLNDDNPILPCYSYLDKRTENIVNETLSNASLPFLYERTGISLNKNNTIFQLYDDLLKRRLNDATDFLMISEYMIYKLTGVKVKDYSLAVPTGLVNLESKDFDNKIIGRLRLPKRLFKDLVKEKTVIRNLSHEVMKVVGLNIPVVVGANTEDNCFWESIRELNPNNDPFIINELFSKIAVPVTKYINNETSQESGWSNISYLNEVIYSKSIMGLDILFALQKEIKVMMDKMAVLAKSCEVYQIFNVFDKCFQNVSQNNMKNTIKEYFIDNNMEFKDNNAFIVNSIFHSVAYLYANTIKELEKMTKKTFSKIFMVGTYSKNEYLNELIRKYSEKELIVLPIETSINGSLKVQMDVVSKIDEKEIKNKKSIFNFWH